ncbi:E3 ubiquitin-protein ligase rad18 [Spiromyces aspiralis]|uniref:E3 ubiquitin-protein ligase rad18 n=1 Tax=Spiromyces aspiralis TaxID=68401 RepID=A0ACC1HWK9_9FUNG|nr:E3 ubiquitin-protein ligase rad18 [Spiromyces aspiralis]
MDMDFVDIEDPTDWPEALPHLHQLDAHLRCPICKEYFTTAMMLTSCGHNFCSLCIRRYLTTEKKCPSCRKSVDDSELLPNRLIDSITRSFRSNRWAMDGTQEIYKTKTAKKR